jgi:hypothetical protein
MTLVDASRLEIKLGSFRSGSSMAISDPTVAQRVQEYRSRKMTISSRRRSMASSTSSFSMRVKRSW